jgi:peptidoglycan/xylan/chitin deacetylase (PgdA/CDA1 family)
LYDWQDDRVIVRHEKPKVLLTFDDGPTEYLPEILSILKAENVQGLFFWQSQRLNENVPWQRLFRDGHFIGSHAHSHPMLTKLSYEEQFEEMKKSKAGLKRLTGQTVKWFRPPYGLYNEDTMKVAGVLDLEIVLWQVASWDWKHETDCHQIVENVAEYTKPGDIVLLHELPQTVKILTILIRTLRKQGLLFSEPHTTLKLRKNKGLSQRH